MYLPTNLEETTLIHIEALKEAGVQEGTALDYKEVIEFKGDARKGLITDVTALANTVGGEIVIGVTEARDEKGAKQGVIDQICGIEYSGGFDALQLAIRSTLQDNVIPQLPSIQMGQVKLENGRFVLVIRVPRSYVGPHTYKNWCIFYVRSGSQNSQMDVIQTRNLFLENASVPERVRAIIERRLEGIDRAQPIQLFQPTRWVLHIIPIQALDPTFNLNIESLSQKYLAPIGSGANTSFPNIDGLVSVCSYQGGWESFALACRNGVVETASCGYFATTNDPPQINHVAITKNSNDFVIAALNYLKDRGVQGPFFVTGTLINVGGFTLITKPGSDTSMRRQIDRSVISLPIVEFPFSADPKEVIAGMQTLYQTIANAAGYMKVP